MNKQFLSTTQLAKLLGLSRITIFKKIKNGEIKAQRVGRNYIIDNKLLPEISGKVLDQKTKEILNQAVAKTVKEYGETLRLLGRE